MVPYVTERNKERMERAMQDAGRDGDRSAGVGTPGSAAGSSLFGSGAKGEKGETGEKKAKFEERGENWSNEEKVFLPELPFFTFSCRLYGEDAKPTFILGQSQLRYIINYGTTGVGQESIVDPCEQNGAGPDFSRNSTSSGDA